jgi:hypothetical protein
VNRRAIQRRRREGRARRFPPEAATPHTCLNPASRLSRLNHHVQSCPASEPLCISQFSQTLGGWIGPPLRIPGHLPDLTSPAFNTGFFLHFKRFRRVSKVGMALAPRSQSRNRNHGAQGQGAADLPRIRGVLVISRDRYSAHLVEPSDDEPARVHDEHLRVRIQTRRPARDGAHPRLSARTHIEILGPFLPAVVGDNGQILSPMGAPNAVWFLARRPGRATIDVVTGDPWQAPQTTTLDITIEP